jgi:hypothetical protein
MLEHKWPRLLPMTLSAVLVKARHGQATGRSATGATGGFENVASVRIVALHTIHLTLDYGMMLRHSKFRLCLQVALKTGDRIFSRIHNELAAPSAGLHMFAARPMARFATRLPAEFRVFDMDARMRTRGKNPRDVCVTLRTSVIADVSCARNIRRRNDRARESRTRDGEKHYKE